MNCCLLRYDFSRSMSVCMNVCTYNFTGKTRIQKYLKRCIRCFNYELKPSIFFFRIKLYHLFKLVNVTQMQKQIFLQNGCLIACYTHRIKRNSSFISWWARQFLFLFVSSLYFVSHTKPYTWIVNHHNF